jgi:hypothetical protein
LPIVFFFSLFPFTFSFIFRKENKGKRKKGRQRKKKDKKIISQDVRSALSHGKSSPDLTGAVFWKQSSPPMGQE